MNKPQPIAPFPIQNSYPAAISPAPKPKLIAQADRAAYFDESGWQHRLDTDDHALCPPDSDIGLYILLGVILVGGAALFAASAYVLLG